MSDNKNKTLVLNEVFQSFTKQHVQKTEHHENLNMKTNTTGIVLKQPYLLGDLNVR